MNRDTMIGMLETLTGEEDAVVLSTYLDLAADAIINRAYPYRNDIEGLEVPAKYQRLQIDICVYMLNKRGAEGETQHIENGIHRNYKSADIPEDMLSRIVPYVGVICS